MELSRFKTLAIDTCNAFRCGYEGKANELFAQVLEQLGPIMNALPEESVTFIHSVLPVMADAQQRGDTIYLCDILQYEVLPLIAKD